MKCDGIKRRAAAQMRAAETAIVKNDNLLAARIEQAETGLDRIRAEPRSIAIVALTIGRPLPKTLIAPKRTGI